MSRKSFSGRLSWRIIGIVSVISIMAQIMVALVSLVIISKEMARNPSLDKHPIDLLLQSIPMQIALIVIVLASFVAIFFVCRGVIRRMTSPISELSDAALKMAQGDLKAQLPEITSGDEMQHLHDSFQTMQNSLIDYIEELKVTTAANERMEADLALARNIQMGMLRKDFPPFLHALLYPAKEVGGDLYDFNLKGDQLYFAIGDVSGKGLPASLVMAITSAILRFVVESGQPMDETLCRINNSFSETNRTGMFVTLFVARVNLKTGHMDYCNAGHNPILVMPPDAEPYFLKSKPNLAIGMFENFTYEAENIDFKPNTRLIAYTDGVTEAEREDLSQFGSERLMAWAQNKVETLRAMPLQEKDIVESLYASVKDFVGANAQNDDITIVSLQL